jgi:hypothetical protein
VGKQNAGLKHEAAHPIFLQDQRFERFRRLAVVVISRNATSWLATAI